MEHTPEKITFSVQLFKEGSVYIAYVPEFDVSSCGDTEEQARTKIKDAVLLFLDRTGENTRLDDILEEAGYRLQGKTWIAPEILSLDRLTLSLK